jgi:hypothetical protein
MPQLPFTVSMACETSLFVPTVLLSAFPFDAEFLFDAEFEHALTASVMATAANKCIIRFILKSFLNESPNIQEKFE